MNITIVGNKFSGSLNNKKIVTAAYFLENFNKQLYQNDSIVFLGQGIRKRDLKTICNILSSKKILYESCIGNNVIEKKKYVHKAHSKNVMITKPKKILEHKFSSMLYISDNCEMLNDHVTGVHLQGLLIIEAARQKMISVIENFFLEKKNNFNKRFTLININSIFIHFLLPASVKIISILNILSVKNNNLTAKINCDFIQNNTICATININFSVRDEKTVLRKESILAEHGYNKTQHSFTNKTPDTTQQIASPPRPHSF